MVSIYKRWKANGTYVYHMSYYINGRHSTKTTRISDKALARKIATQKEKEIASIEQGLEPEHKIQPILLSEFIEAYLEHRERQCMAPKTIAMDAQVLHRLLEYTGDCNIVTITDMAVQKFKYKMLETLSKTSVSIELRSLRTAFNFAIEKPGTKYIRRNPFSQKGLIPSPKNEDRKIPKCLSPDEKAKFLSAIDNPEHMQLFKFFLLTGCRRGEALNLQWSDIDLEQKQLTFRNTKSRKDRTLPISLELMQIIISLDRSKPKPFNYRPNTVTRQFKRYLHKSGIEKDLHLHNLRHTAGSDLVRQGIHLKKIQKYLGHASVKTTEIYTHVLPEDLREVADALTCVG